MKIKIMLAIAFLAAILTACSLNAPRIAGEFDRFEFGDVVNGTIVSKEIIIENKGNSKLVIEEIATSCGCTTATVEPGTISSGGTGVLRIEFDSGAHGPELVGLLTRQVFIKTNDPSSPEIIVEFSANVVK